MKFNFKKISAIATSVLMTGMTVGSAMAVGISPTDLGGQGNFAIVYGSTANSMDQAQATAIDTALRNQFSTSTSVVVGDVAIADEDIVLGGLINSGKIPSTIKNNKLDNLVKEKLSWDSGAGSVEYDIHEEIIIGTMKVLTTLDDEKLEGFALSNEKALEYKLALDEAFPLESVGATDADDLYLSILGEEYEITDMTSNSITVTTSSSVSMTKGEKYSLSSGETVTLVDVYSNAVEIMVDGESDTITTVGSSKKINGVKVEISSIGYHENAPETGKAILKIGKDISKTYSNGEEYIGQDEDDPLWVWDISLSNSTTGYIGVKYNAKIDSANDEIAGDSIKYLKGGYIFPDNYAAVTLDSVTGAEYQDIKISFEDSEDLFNAADGSTARVENPKILLIEGDEEDTFTVAGKETSKIGIWYNTTSDNFETYYLDSDGDYSPTSKMRLANESAGAVTAVTMGDTELATAEIGDTNLDLDLNVVAGIATLVITNDDDSNSNVVNVTIGGTIINATAGTGTLEYLGTTKDDAEAGDVYFQGNDYSTKDYSYMDHYGVKIAEGSKVSDDAEEDVVSLSIPEEKVLAKVSVSMGASTTSTGSVGNMIFRDTESGYAGKNVVIVGGSCVNSAAATVLGVASDRGVPGCYADTGLEAGQFLIKKGLLSGKTAIVVAGYEADDTAKAAQYLINKGAVEGKYSSTTSETITA